MNPLKKTATVRHKAQLALSIIVAVFSLLHIDVVQAARPNNDFLISSKEMDTGKTRAYFYGSRTVVELGDMPLYFSVVDDAGNPIPFKREGKVATLGDHVDSFTASVDGKTVRFTSYDAEAEKSKKQAAIALAERKKWAAVEPMPTPAIAPTPVVVASYVPAAAPSPAPTPAPARKLEYTPLPVKTVPAPVAVTPVEPMPPAQAPVVASAPVANTVPVPAVKKLEESSPATTVAASSSEEKPALQTVEIEAVKPKAPEQVWEIRKTDGTLYGTLSRWSQRANWQLIYDTEGNDFPIELEASFTGDFESAVLGVMQSLEYSKYPVRACTWDNKPKPVVRIIHKNKRCKDQ